MKPNLLVISFGEGFNFYRNYKFKTLMAMLGCLIYGKEKRKWLLHGLFCLLVMVTNFMGCSDDLTKKKVGPGMTINRSTLFDEQQQYKVVDSSFLKKPLIVVEGDDLTVDFNGLKLEGLAPIDKPDQYDGIGVMVKNGRNITIKNLNVRGFKTALFVEHVDSLTLEQCDFSYNFRPTVKHIDRGNLFSDTSRFLINDTIGWEGIGSGVYLRNCLFPTVREVKITNGYHGILLHHCDSGLILNNQVQYNSGVGVVAFHSSHNRIFHNALDWNINADRPLEKGGHNTGSGIFMSSGSVGNQVAFNTVSHCGDGLLLGGPQVGTITKNNNHQPNLIYKNDFSFALNHGILAAQMEDAVIFNLFEDCPYGISVGYGQESLIAGNRFIDGECALSFNGGRDLVILRNLLDQYHVGIRLGQVTEKTNLTPLGIESRHFVIHQNIFRKCTIPFDLLNAYRTNITKNGFSPFKISDLGVKSSEGLIFKDNVDLPEKDLTAFFLDTMTTNLPATIQRIVPMIKEDEQKVVTKNISGRDLVLIGAWGPYNFEYPSVWVRGQESNQYTLLLLGPIANWQIVEAEGVAMVNPQRGTFPATVVIKTLPNARNVNMTFSIIGEEMLDQFGRMVPKGSPLQLHFQDFIDSL